MQRRIAMRLYGRFMIHTLREGFFLILLETQRQEKPAAIKNTAVIERISASANIKPAPYLDRSMKAVTAKKAAMDAMIKEIIESTVINEAIVFFILKVIKKELIEEYQPLHLIFGTDKLLFRDEACLVSTIGTSIKILLRKFYEKN